jgi:hypothetical protein
MQSYPLETLDGSIIISPVGLGAREPLDAFDAYYAGFSDAAEAVSAADRAVKAKLIPATEEGTYRLRVFQNLLKSRMNRGELVQPSADELRKRA